jgi:hypothetical protein
MACQLYVGGPRPPDQPLKASAGQSDQLDDIWNSVRSVAVDTGEVTLIFNEQQITSYLALRLSQDERPLLDQPQVFLRDGEIRIYGIAALGPLEAGTLLSIQPILDSEGGIAFEITSAEFGPLPAPETLTEGLSSLLTEAFTGKLGPLATGLRITSLAISGGEVAIVGTLR